MQKTNRWVLLKHNESSEDLLSFHFDLLIEDGLNCRSWRLSQIPQLNGPALKITSIAPHNLSWLDTAGREVSGGRGWASPVSSGFFIGELPQSNDVAFQIKLLGEKLTGTLMISKQQCFLRS